MPSVRNVKNPGIEAGRAWWLGHGLVWDEAWDATSVVGVSTQRCIRDAISRIDSETNYIYIYGNIQLSVPACRGQAQGSQHALNVNHAICIPPG